MSKGLLSVFGIGRFRFAAAANLSTFIVFMTLAASSNPEIYGIGLWRLLTGLGLAGIRIRASLS